jgi:hypothetical protein
MGGRGRWWFGGGGERMSLQVITTLLTVQQTKMAGVGGGGDMVKNGTVSILVWKFYIGKFRSIEE